MSGWERASRGWIGTGESRARGAGRGPAQRSREVETRNGDVQRERESQRQARGATSSSVMFSACGTDMTHGGRVLPRLHDCSLHAASHIRIPGTISALSPLDPSVDQGIKWGAAISTSPHSLPHIASTPPRHAWRTPPSSRPGAESTAFPAHSGENTVYKAGGLLTWVGTCLCKINVVETRNVCVASSKMVCYRSTDG